MVSFGALFMSSLLQRSFIDFGQGVTPRVRGSHSCMNLALDDQMEEIDSLAVLTTQRWIKDFVIRLGLCPYASDVFNTEGRIRYVVSHATNGADLVEDFFCEAAILLDEDPLDITTTMLTAPLYNGGIEDFYALYEWLVDTLEDEDETILNNQVQPAFFHPDWTFDGLHETNPVHFEKRAPFPVINLLRRKQLEDVASKGLARGVVVSKQIADHNAARLQQEGFEALEACFKSLNQSN